MARQNRLMTSLLALAATGALLAGCDRRETAGVPPIGSMETAMALQDGPPPPMAYGPAANALEPGEPLRVTALGPAPERYRYIDDAYDMVDAFGDSPPDYAFDYGGVEPWVWRSDEGYYRVAEAIPGGYREYYYGPDGDAPFLVRDPRYSYAYDAGALVAIYDARGRVQPAAFVVRQADYAGRYYARARTLHYAALHQERRRPYAEQWRASEPALTAPRRHWAEARNRDVEWRRLRETQSAVRQTTWAHERQTRAQQAPQLAEQGRRPEAVAAHAPSATPAERRDRGHGREDRRGPERFAETPRADAAQQHAAPAAGREAAQAEIRQRQAERRAGRGQAERRAERPAQVEQPRPEPPRAQAENRRGREDRPQARAERQAPHVQAQAAREERVRAEPRPQRNEAPNAQAHGRPASAQPHDGGPERHGGGPKGGGGEKGGNRGGGDRHEHR